MAQIFLSYRRSDSAYPAANLSDKLKAHFGKDSVFFDIDTIPLGVDFRTFIGNEVGKCDVLIAIIGDEWVGSADESGKRRIDDPSDFVRIEIESALKRDIPVIPVLVGEMEMPSAADLPPSIQDIAYRNATELRAGRDLPQHFELLIKGLESLFSLKKLPDEKAASEKDTVHDSKPARVSDKAPSELMAPSVLEEIQKSLEGFTDEWLFVGTIAPKRLRTQSAHMPLKSHREMCSYYMTIQFSGARKTVSF